MKDAAPRLTTPGEVLRKALAKEEEAYHFYSQALDQSKIELVRDLLAQLKDEEAKHVRLVRNLMTRLAS